MGIPTAAETKRPWLYKGMPPRRKPALGADGFRNCIDCHVRKYKSEFHNNKKRHGGISPVCKICSAKRSSLYEKKNPIRRAMQRHGMTVADYDKMLVSQGYSCGICGTKDFGGGNGRFSIDHCHKTGKVRGLLCTKCNWGIGHLNDSVVVLRAAIAYLENGDL